MVRNELGIATRNPYVVSGDASWKLCVNRPKHRQHISDEAFRTHTKMAKIGIKPHGYKK